MKETNNQTQQKVFTKVVIDTKLGKDGRTFNNVKLVFLDYKGNELYSVVVKPAFEQTAKQYGLYQSLINRVKE